MAKDQQLAQKYFETIKRWIAEREASQDFSEYERRGKINRQVLLMS